MKRWEGVAALCVKPGEPRLLMVLQGKPGQPPTWALPGGQLKSGESPEQGVLREVREDAGLDVKIKRLYNEQEDTTEDEKKQPYRFTSHYFEVETGSEMLRPQDPDQQVYRAEWISKNQFLTLGLMYEYQREIIKSFWTEVIESHAA